MMATKAKRRFGQNFLQDPQIIDQIVACIQPNPEQSLIEIGPGRGALTKPLATLRSDLIVIELDRDLIPKLQAFLPATATVRQGDVLDFDFAEIPGDLWIVGNLPYNISTPLLFRLFALGQRIKSMIFMLQKEVVNRLAAVPNHKDYGRLTVMAQYHCHIEKLLDVPPTAFDPAPKVDSAVVSLQPHQRPNIEADDLSILSELLTAAFGQRRKTLKNSLANLISASALEDLGINPSARAETLSVADFVRCANVVSRNRR